MATGGGGSLITDESVLCGWKAARGRFSTMSIVPAEMRRGGGQTALPILV